MNAFDIFKLILFVFLGIFMFIGVFSVVGIFLMFFIAAPILLFIALM